MTNDIKSIINKLVPPIAHDVYRRYFLKSGFAGNYKTWDDARKASDGYDSEVILGKVKNALLKVRNGEAVFERDSVLFDEVQYSWPLLAGLLWAASQNDNRLNLIDFGGSLRSSYFQNRKFLQFLKELRWSVIEQRSFVDCGRRHFENDQLKFFYTLDECIAERHPEAILLSSVLQYLEKPYELLENIIARQFACIIVDRTMFLEAGKDRITVQTVPADIYQASYPARFFDRERFLVLFRGKYEIMARFDAIGGTIDLEDACAHDEGFIFRKK